MRLVLWKNLIVFGLNVSKMKSKSSNMTYVLSSMQILITKWRHYYSKCVPTLYG